VQTAPLLQVVLPFPRTDLEQIIPQSVIQEILRHFPKDVRKTVIQTQQGITAIELKSGDNTQSKSLASFIKRYEPQRAIRLSTKPFGSGGSIMSIPLYAAFCIW